MTRGAPAPELFSERYELRAPLGEGGMARVYRVFDRVRGFEVALKQLTAAPGTPVRGNVASLFEREFQTLVQLSHPNVIAVYDYGVPPEGGPYYTMELLDGGDLLDCVPLPWQQACRLMFDVCSSLALLHSRRLLHRDISPRNVRCTRDGRAKLIDFGAMDAMTAGGAQVLGTPAFAAPETLHRLALDARTDLYSVGATLYYALTGRLPYPGRTFADMLVAWTGKLVPPSALAPEVPAALDDLVLSLVHVEPALRPPSAYDVMHRLSAIAALDETESELVGQAYLSTPTLVGRAAALDQLRKQLLHARALRVGGTLIKGPSGCGRSRLLDACALEAKTLGFYVLRVVAGGTGGSFDVAQALVQGLFDVQPQLRALPEAAALLETPTAPDAPPVFKTQSEWTRDPSQTQRAFCELIGAISRVQPLLLAVDDVHRIDPPSAAVLLGLLDARRTRAFVALTSDSEAADNAATVALQRRCELLVPPALTRAQTQELLGSLFGDVAHLGLLSEEIYRGAAGNPGQTIGIAEDLVDRGVIRYASGAWILPSRLSPDDLPRDITTVLQARAAKLTAPARHLAEAHALAYFEHFSDQDYHALLPSLGSAQIEHALSELSSAQVIVRDGLRYGLCCRAWVDVLTRDLSPEALAAHHSALVKLYAGRSSLAQTHHAFLAGLDELGLELLLSRHRDASRIDYQQLLEHNLGKMMWTYEPAIATAIRLNKPARQVHELRRWQIAGAISLEWGSYNDSARIWFRQLEHDSGLDLYRADETAPATERLTRALQGAYQRYLATPEPERVYPVDEAIRLLAEYVAYCIALGGRAQDTALVRELPGILEPFVALSPILDAIWENALATRRSLCDADFEGALDSWASVLAKLDALSGQEVQHLDVIRNAVMYALAVMRVQLGRSAETSALVARLDDDPAQCVAAMTLRRIERLEAGDWRGAERFRRQAETLALERRWPQMFKSSLLAEVSTCARAGDLNGLQLVVEQMQQLVTHFPGWLPNLWNAEGFFHLVRGDQESALAKFQDCIALTTPDERGHSCGLGMWLSSQAGAAEALFGLERYVEARSTAASGLQQCEARGLGSQSFELIRILALCEHKQGQALAAIARVEGLIERQRQLGASGLRLGLSYETRARLALWSGDSLGFEQYATLTAQAYRHGAGSPLGARYERLANEAKRLGMRAVSASDALAASTSVSAELLATHDLVTVVSRSMAGKLLLEDRADAALRLLCAGSDAGSAHVFVVARAEQAPVLCASRGQPASSALSDAVSAFWQAELCRSDALDEMNTGELEDMGTSRLFEDDGVHYELLPLRCVVGSRSRLVGVVAATAAASPTDRSTQAQLLSALAAHLQPTGC